MIDVGRREILGFSVQFMARDTVRIRIIFVVVGGKGFDLRVGRLAGVGILGHKLSVALGLEYELQGIKVAVAIVVGFTVFPIS